jgi:hypothetical protein
MRNKKLLIYGWLLVQLVPGAPTQAYVVHDPIHTLLNIMQQCIGQASQATYHVQDIAKYVTTPSNRAPTSSVPATSSRKRENSKTRGVIAPSASRLAGSLSKRSA